jgi:hypothetical protein
MINTLKLFIYIACGIYFIISPVIFKVILIKLPKNIEELHFIIVFGFCCIYIFSIINYIKLILKITTEKDTFMYNIKIKFQEFLQKYYFDSMKLIDNYIKHDLLGPNIIGKSLLKVSIFINKKINRNNAFFWFVFLDILPKLNFIIIFCYDILIKNQFCYTYFFGGFLLIPLILKYLIYTFKEFTLANLRILHKDYLVFVDDHFTPLLFNEVIKIYEITYFNENYLEKKIKFIYLKEETTIDTFDETLNYYLDQFHLFTKTYHFCIYFEHIQKLSLYYLFCVIMTSIYFSLWSYILKVSFYTLNDFSFTVNFLTFITPYAALPDPFSNVIFPGPEELVFVYDATIIQILIRIILGY